MKKTGTILLLSALMILGTNITFASSISDEPIKLSPKLYQKTVDEYTKVTSEEKIKEALDLLKGTVGDFSFGGGA